MRQGNIELSSSVSNKQAQRPEHLRSLQAEAPVLIERVLHPCSSRPAIAFGKLSPVGNTPGALNDPAGTTTNTITPPPE